MREKSSILHWTACQMDIQIKREFRDNRDHFSMVTVRKALTGTDHIQHKHEPW